MHDIRSFHVRVAFVWHVNGCLGVIAYAFKWRVTLVGKFNYWALLTPSWEIFSRTEGTTGDGTHPRP